MRNTSLPRFVIPRRLRGGIAILLFACSAAAVAQSGVQQQTLAYVPAQDELDTEVNASALPADAFEAALYNTPNGVRVPYRLLPPKPMREGERYPLVVVLHGGYGIGNDNASQLGAFERSWAYDDIRDRYPAYVLVPQARTRTARNLPASRGAVIAETGPALDDMLSLAEHIRDTYAIDPQRIYVTGYSMGGSAALQAVVAKPKLIAGVVSVAGVPPATKFANAAAGTPAMLVQGDADTESPYASAVAWTQALASHGAKPELLTYTGMPHRLPSDMLTGTGWRDWLFAQRKP
ncbi:alpha/beta fold hydrolase [Pseudomonadota bacterium AL_CKDN230030165-1A_HGKHYDSX7]